MTDIEFTEFDAPEEAAEDADVEDVEEYVEEE